MQKKDLNPTSQNTQSPLDKSTLEKSTLGTSGTSTIDKAFLGHPKPIFSLSMTELWERFSFYGIRPLIVLFMVASIELGGFGYSKDYSAAIAGIFGGCLYLASLPGGFIADHFLGQKKAIFFGAIIIALGHLSIALSFFYPRAFFLGLGLIVVGTGLFKTCASVMVGMLYGKDDARRDSGFTIFYMGINIGAFIAPLLCGALFDKVGYHFGFGAGGLGMLLAVLIFYFKTIPDLKEFDSKVGIKYEWDRVVKPKVFIVLLLVIAFILWILFLGEFITLSPITIAKNMVIVILICTTLYFLYLFFFSSLDTAEKKNLGVFVILFFASSMFWSVYEQQYTSFNFFADSLTDKNVFGFNIPTAWFQSINPLFIIIFAPIIALVWIKLAKKNLEISSISKFALGTLGVAIGFLIMVLAVKNIISENGSLASPWWLVFSLLFLTLGELCLSPVGLSIMTKIAPSLIKSQVMGLWFVTSSLGNVIAGLIGGHVSEENIQSLPDLFLNCALILIAVSVILFLLKKYIGKIAG